MSRFLFLLVRSAEDIPTDVPVVGVEIPGNRSDLIPLLTRNIDPQHGGSTNTGRCAAEEAYHLVAGGYRPPPNVAFVTTRIDFDAVATVAILSFTDLEAFGNADFAERLKALGDADSFRVSGPWPGPRPLPKRSDPFLVHGQPGDIASLAAPNQVCQWAAEGQITLDQAVNCIEWWLHYGPPTLRPVDWSAAMLADADLLAKAEHETLDHMRLGVIAVDKASVGYGGVVYHDAIQHGPMSASLGYCLGPISVVKMKDPSGFLRFTISSYDEGRFDAKLLAERLTLLEDPVVGAGPRPKWGGGSRIIGSPQGRSTLLNEDQVLIALYAAIADAAEADLRTGHVPDPDDASVCHRRPR